MPCPGEHKSVMLLFLIVSALGWCGLALSLSLGFGLFHGFLSLSGLFGAGFGTLFALFVEDLLAAQQFEKSLVGAVAFVPGGADDAGVSAVAIAETGADGVKELHYRFIGHQVRRGETASR